MRDVTLFEPAESGDDTATGPTERIRMVLSYDGTDHHGFAPNPGVRTIGGTLAAALEAVLRQPVDLTCAGRTDKGVHARAQVVTFDVPAGRVEPEWLRRAVDNLCGPEIAIRAVDVVAPDFDARLSAVSRRYRYQLHVEPIADPLRSRFSWHVAQPLDIAAMRLGCDPLLGEHDFRAFCRRPRRRTQAPVSLGRRVTELRIVTGDDGDLRVEIEANAFCHQMVRSIVGTLVDVGRGRLRAGDLRAILATGDRSEAGEVAPPEGLVLWRVRYGDGWSTDDLNEPPGPTRSAH